MQNEQKKNKTLLILLILFILLLAVVITLFYLRGTEDTWLCKNGQWVKHGSPSEPMPDYQCETQEQTESDGIKVFSPKPNEEIESPLEITGEAIGPWYFEGDFPIELVDENDKILATGFVTAQGEWMTEDFVEFKSSLKFDSGEATSGKLIFRKDNPSGLPEHDEEFIVPVKFKSTEDDVEKMTVKVFFSNTNLDPEVTCQKVFPVEREIEKTLAVSKAAIEELLKGVTDAEKDNRYQTSINNDVKLNSIKIENKTAYADFNEQLHYQVGGSCRISLIRHQIEQTLKQFSSIDNVVISIYGKTEDILQP